MIYNELVQIAVGLTTGILSGFGIGGGSLLMLWLTCLADIGQRTAAGMNLLYFLCCAPPALLSHWKHHLIDWRAVFWAVAAGIPLSIIGCILSSNLDLSIIRRGFGLLLLWIGVRELLAKQERTSLK